MRRRCLRKFRSLPSVHKPATPCNCDCLFVPQTKGDLLMNVRGCYDRFWWIAARRARRAGVDDPLPLASQIMQAVVRRFKPSKGRFEPYFNKAVRRRTAGALRAQRSRLACEVHLPEDFDLTFVFSPSPHSVSESLREAVEELLRKLRNKERELFTLRFWIGYDCGKIAKLTGLTKSAVVNRLSRAYKKARKFLAPWAPSGWAERKTLRAKRSNHAAASDCRSPEPTGNGAMASIRLHGRAPIVRRPAAI
jgi:RNA polymerase sigma factor (sigma-70 family)